MHRLRGEFDEAEQAYRHASRHGREPQPGLALLRLAQGDGAAAATAIRRVVGETADGVERTKLLPAYVEIMLVEGELDEARTACSDLAPARDDQETDLLRAMRSYAEGAVDLAAGDAWAALGALRRALTIYEELEVPYEVARARVLIAVACRALGDDEAAQPRAGCSPRGLSRASGRRPTSRGCSRYCRLAPSVRGEHGLTPRELEVLRLVAAGKTNHAIAAELVISERTVARHVSNIFAKLRLSSRSAATAFAYEHGLV